MAEKNMNAKISVEFEETANRQQLSSGDNLPTLFGKIKKFFTDLKTVCFSGSYIDLSDRPTTATTETDGLMSATDKTKLDGADNKYALKSKYGDTTINVGRKSGTTVGKSSTAEGYNTTASDYYSHAEGYNTTASGYCSHAEGYETTASGHMSHAEGQGTTASGDYSHAEGYETTASGDYSHAEGNGTIANNKAEHAFGKYNQSNNDTLFSIGDGTSDTARHNAFEITKVGGKLHDKDIATTDIIPDLSAYAKKTDIPTKLPANGGNADYATNAGNANTVGNYDAYHLGTVDENEVYYAAGKFPLYCRYNAVGDGRFSLLIDNRLQPDTECKVRCDYATDTDTIDGLHAYQFLKGTADTPLTTSINELNKSGTYSIESGITPDFPSGYGTYGLLDSRIYGSVVYQTVRFENGNIIHRSAVFGTSNWTDWNKLSSLKSVQVSGSTDAYGNLVLWATSNNRKPVFVEMYGHYTNPYLITLENSITAYSVGLINCATHQPAANAVVSGVAYYIEL